MSKIKELMLDGKTLVIPVEFDKHGEVIPFELAPESPERLAARFVKATVESEAEIRNQSVVDDPPDHVRVVVLCGVELLVHLRRYMTSSLLYAYTSKREPLARFAMAEGITVLNRWPASKPFIRGTDDEQAAVQEIYRRCPNIDDLIEYRQTWKDKLIVDHSNRLDDRMKQLEDEAFSHGINRMRSMPLTHERIHDDLVPQRIDEFAQFNKSPDGRVLYSASLYHHQETPLLYEICAVAYEGGLLKRCVAILAEPQDQLLAQQLDALLEQRVNSLFGKAA